MSRASRIASVTATNLVEGLPTEVYQQAVAQADMAISITDAHANIIYANAAFSRVTGYALEEVHGHNEAILSNHTTPRSVYASLWTTISSGMPWTGKLLNRRKDGSKYLAELSITPVLGPEGKPRHFLGMHRDITDVHRLGQANQNQRQLIESVIDVAPVAIALLDESGKVILDNQGYKKLVSDLNSPEPSEVLLAALHALDAGAADSAQLPRQIRHVEREVRIERPGRPEPRWFVVTTVPLEVAHDDVDAFFVDRPLQCLLLVAADITRLRIEQERARTSALSALLAEVEHTAALRESLYAAIYRAEEPLNLMASAVGRLRARGDSAVSAALEQALGMGREHLEELRKLIPGARIEPTTAINLNEVLRDVLAVSTTRMLHQSITMEWRPAPVLPNILGRALQLRSAFKALVDNAIDAVDSRQTRRELAVTTRREGDVVAVVVADSGPGIPGDLKLKAFEPFFTTRGGEGRNHMGTGLSRAQQTIAEHGGTIEILDAPEGGCRVRVEFPVGGPYP